MIETHPTLAQQEFIAKEMLHRRNVRILRIMLLVLLLALWELCARLGIINDFIFSSPSRMTICFISMVKDGTIFLHTGVTVMETLVSFARRRGRSCDRDSVMVQPQCIRGFRALSRHAQQPS